MLVGKRMSKKEMDKNKEVIVQKKDMLKATTRRMSLSVIKK